MWTMTYCSSKAGSKQTNLNLLFKYYFVYCMFLQPITWNSIGVCEIMDKQTLFFPFGENSFLLGLTVVKLGNDRSVSWFSNPGYVLITSVSHL